MPHTGWSNKWNIKLIQQPREEKLLISKQKALSSLALTQQML